MNLSDYQPASIGGVSVLVPRNSGNFGRNAIEHLYPDSEQHYVEDNGKLLRKYSFPAIVHGKKVKSEFLALQAVIERPGPTTVVHPHFGAIFVQMGDCSFDITQSDAGVVTVQISCSEAGSPALPGLVTGSGAAIGGLTASALIAMASLFKSSYLAPLNPVSFSTIENTLRTVAGTISGVFNTVEDYPRILVDVYSSAAIADVDKLASNLFAVFRRPVRDDNIENITLYDGWSETVRKIQKTVLFEPFDVTTTDLKTRHEALTAIQAFVFGGALIHFCESVAVNEYATADHAVRDRRRISELNSFISKSIDHEVRLLINEIVTETIEYLNSLEIQLPKIETINLDDWPVASLAYQLYGPGTENMQTLIDINQNKNLMLLTGELNVLRDGR